MEHCTVAALYGFAPVERPKALCASILEVGKAAEIVGTILVAPEGINGTVAGTAEGVNQVLERLRSEPGFEALEAKFSHAAAPPFGRLRVRVKREIVSMGVPEIDPRRRVGTYVEPEDWNAVLEDEKTLVIDTRNAYEVRIGTFDGAVDPGTASFRDFPQWARENIDPRQYDRVAMFCTGGIRCEKATSLLLREGVQEVVHLRGGILRYLEKIPPSDSRWQGECFVFDRRVAVNHALQPGEHTLCYGCLEPLSPKDIKHEAYEEGVCCHRCVAQTSDDLRVRRRERMKQVRTAKARGERHLHVGPDPEEL